MKPRDAQHRFTENDPRQSFAEKYCPCQETGCWNWTGGITGNGYGNFTSKAMGFIQGISAHRASWLLHRGPINDGLFVLHKCDNKKCVNPDHLFLGTQKENVHDCARKGRRVIGRPSSKKGSENPNARYRELDIAQMRGLRAEGVRNIQIAALFEDKPANTHSILRRKSWRHVLA